jgi:hypothetical protein
MPVKIDSPSHMLLQMHMDGGDDWELKVPTFWDAIEEQWSGAIKLPKSKKLLIAHGKDSFELQNNFNIALSKLFHDPAYQDEVFSMFTKIEEE